jgi:phosphate-selective porin OprO/OprP
MRKLIFLAVLVAVTAAGAASAQVVGLYYAEEAKDGRIYVFNTPERLAQFKETGQMEGTALTLVGRGPNGETVVAENETAADLFFFKHGLPGYERQLPDTKLPFGVSWKDGKTTLTFKGGALGISNRLQARFTEQLPEAGDDRGSFRVRRMKTKFDGWVHDQDLSYELQLNWADTGNALEDANVNYDFTAGKKALQLKFGQFKVPFGRQELTSSGSQQFVDRAAVSNTFARGRDLGVQLWGLPARGRLDWRVGIFNGEGRNQTANLNTKFQYDARLTWQPFGDVKYSESDFESSDRPLFALAAQYESNDRHGTTAGNDQDREIVGADAVFKLRGFSLYGELFDADADPESGADFGTDGWILQAGYFVIPAKLELALRAAQLDPSDLVDGNEQEERGLALNWFFAKHAYKLQADYRQLENQATGSEDDELRLQYQLIF